MGTGARAPPPRRRAPPRRARGGAGPRGPPGRGGPAAGGAAADRAEEVEARGLPGDRRREDAPREREPSRTDRNVDEEDPAPVDRREESADERPDRRADRGRGAHDPELSATPPARDRLAQEAETVRDEGGRGDRLIQPEKREDEDRVRRGGAGGRDSEIDEGREHHVAAAKTIADAPRDRLKRGHRDEVRGDDPARLRDLDAQIARDPRKGDH